MTVGGGVGIGYLACSRMGRGEIVPERRNRASVRRRRVAERRQEPGADGTERGAGFGAGERFEGVGGNGQAAGMGRALFTERANGICVDEHGDTTITRAGWFP